MNDGLAANGVRNIVQDEYGFIWFGTDNGLCRYDGVKVQPYRIAELDANQYVSALLEGEGQLYIGTEKGVFTMVFKDQIFRRLPLDISSTVTSLALDKEDGLWVSTYEHGVWYYNSKTAQVKRYDIKEGGGPVAQVYIDNDNQVWTVTNWDYPVVYRLNRLHDRFEPLTLQPTALNHSALCMLQTRDGQIWLGTWENGLMLLHSDGQLEQVFSPSESKVGSHIHTLYELSDDCICIGCDDGAIGFNPKTREWHHLVDQQSLKTRFVYAITRDREGGLWLGTFYSGVIYISPVGKRFEAFSMETGLPGNVISRFCEDHEGRLWVASDDGGLMCYLPKEQRFADYPHKDELSRQNVHALCLAKDELWIGTYTSGVLVMNLENGSLRQYIQTSDPHSLDNSSSYAIHHDRQGRIWVATMTGLNRYDRSLDRFERIGETEALVIDIDEDNDGCLWLSTQGNGLIKYCIDENRWVTYRHDARNQGALPDNQVNCALVDESGRLWVATAGGLCQYDKSTDRFKRIALSVPSNNVMSIIEDQGALWLSTERGIVKYAPNQIQRFTLHDGLVSEQFRPNSGIMASDGRIYFGSTSGFNAFYPYQMKANSVMPPVFITSLEIMNQKSQAVAGQPIDMTQSPQVSLDYSDARMLTFSFASLSYCSPGKNQYAYKLEGFDRDWNYVGNQTRATYTNLPPGTYTLRVKATNNDGVWSTHEATLLMVVHPPFWWSWYAKVFYVLLIVAAIWYYVHARLKRAERKHLHEMERLNQEKEKEVREARLNFFTMIAHEIRTPVSLIIGPLEKLMHPKSQDEPNDKVTKEHVAAQLQIIDRNAHRLLELVNQLLDFRKVEQQQFVMHFAPHNIYDIVQSVSVRFEPTFSQGGKRFTVECGDPQLTAIVDREAVTKVISNLLTNAVKYTKDEVSLSCHVSPDEEQFSIIVADNGVGIREEDRRRIFEPFFQAQGNKPGTGIGLNIVRNIVEQHHGSISVSSEPGRGSTFVVTLPMKQQLEERPPVDGDRTTIAPSAKATSDADLSPLTPHRSPLPTILVVDDSEDMVEFLSSNLCQHYHVITAGDGINALHQLSTHQVSIIISDLMMPRMDGMEFCRQVRRNPLTSHIPFILLTAKTDDSSKVEGMDVGADAYIEKPFSINYVEAAIRNILAMRRRLVEKFSTEPAAPATDIASNQTDNEFMARMTKIIEDNLSSSDLSVVFLAEQMGISRSGLFAKIKMMADITPNEMIQVIRLKRAALLLQKNKYTVSEVGYMVGFSNPSYFSKCFQKQFNIKPADYARSFRPS